MAARVHLNEHIDINVTEGLESSLLLPKFTEKKFRYCRLMKFLNWKDVTSCDTEGPVMARN